MLRKATNCDSPYTVKLTEDKAIKLGVSTIPVPCGKCFNCKKRRVAQWSFRLMKELEVSTSAYFVTLTYDTLHVPISENGFMTLLKNSQQSERLQQLNSSGIGMNIDKSLQGFFKRLRYYEEEWRGMYNQRVRKYYESKPIKYYAVGEYGTLRQRPHNHIILFNVCSLESIRKAWTFGGIDIDPDVNQNNIDYTLKYICKEGFKKKHRNDDRIPEFSLMSKGLGKNFMTPEIESFYNSRLDINYTVNDKGYKVALPRYYRDKMMTEETREDAMGIIKRNIDFLTEKEEEYARKHGLNLDSIKQQSKFGRQAKMKNYGSRNVD